MRKLALCLPLLALGACGDTLAQVTDLTGLTAAQMTCIGVEVASMPSDTPKREAAGMIAEACGVDVADVIFGDHGEPTTVVADGTSVLVAE